MTSLVAKRWNGKPVAMPGLYSHMPIEVYHGPNACIEYSVSSSGLRTVMLQSLKHYRANDPHNPKRIERKTTPSMILGSATHHLLLGEANFKSKFAIRPDMINGVKWHGKGPCKVWLADRAKEGKTVITRDMIGKIRGMAESLAAEPLVQAGILNGRIEHSMIWKDQETGLWCRARPDAMPNDALDFADIKTAESVLWHKLQYAIRDYGLYQQAGMIAEGCEVLFKMKLNSFNLIFVESSEPHCIAIVALNPDDIARGIRANRAARRLIANALDTGKWPGPAGEQRDAHQMQMREFDQKDIDFRIEEMERAAKQIAADSKRIAAD